jgi:hypothetical protein
MRASVVMCTQMLSRPKCEISDAIASSEYLECYLKVYILLPPAPLSSENLHCRVQVIRIELHCHVGVYCSMFSVAYFWY